MLHFLLDKTKKRSYTRQIYTEIRKKILSGELEAGKALPSSRDLSEELCVARNTVLTAYDMLVSEGAAYSVAGSGFYVNTGIKYEPQSNSINDRSRSQ